MLDGTTDEADANLIADINAADPFDGGCAADVEEAPATPSKPKDDFLDFIMDKMHQQRRLGIKEGMRRAAEFCLDANHLEAVDITSRKFNEMKD